tara:strand:+ start:169 stop:717 length:549 start_codon:yes stop_codon:yes gene_type:complete
MAYKMKGFSGFGNSPAKQKSKGVVIDGKTYPKGYTKKDVEFLKEQREDVVRYEDLDAAGKKIWKGLRTKTVKKHMKDTKPKLKKQTEKKGKSPLKEDVGARVTLGVDDEAMPFDAFRSRTAINKRNRQRAIDRSKQETELDVQSTKQDQEHQKQMEARKGSRAAGLKPPVEDDNGNGENVEV